MILVTPIFPGKEIDMAKPHTKSPVIGNNGLMTEPGDTSKYLSVNMEIYNMPEIDLRDVEQVEKRLNDYFMLHAENDMKPTVSGMALALNGMSRQTLSAIVHDKPTGSTGYMASLPTMVTDTIKKAHKITETLWESYMVNGKINPVSGIFLAKNNFGYQDKVEIEASSRQEISTGDYGSVADRYKQLPEE